MTTTQILDENSLLHTTVKEYKEMNEKLAVEIGTLRDYKQRYEYKISENRTLYNQLCDLKESKRQEADILKFKITRHCEEIDTLKSRIERIKSEHKGVELAYEGKLQMLSNTIHDANQELSHIKSKWWYRLFKWLSPA